MITLVNGKYLRKIVFEPYCYGHVSQFSGMEIDRNAD